MKKHPNRIGYNDLVSVTARRNGRQIGLVLRDGGFNSIGSAISAAIDRLPVPSKDYLQELTFDVYNVDKSTYGTYNYKYRKID